jgi:beta-glucanase (GH16 family)
MRSSRPWHSVVRSTARSPARRKYWRTAFWLSCVIGVTTACASAATPNALQAVAPSMGVSASTPAGYSGDPGPGWTLTWSDDFSAASSLQDWTFDNGGGGWGNDELQTDDPSNVSLAPGGGLIISASQDGRGQECWYGPCRYSAARMDTQGTFEQEYGLIEARIKLPTGRGLWPAFWMEGSDIDQAHWPAAGEIDVIEINNKTPGLVSGFVHGTEENYGAYYNEPDSLSAGYHVFGVDWTSQGISWLVDGHEYGRMNAYPGWPFSQPFFLILDLAVGGNWPGSPDVSTKFPAQMDVSWIRIYKQN